MSKNLSFQVTLRFEVPSDQPLLAAEKLDELKRHGEILKVKANASQQKKEE